MSHEPLDLNLACMEAPIQIQSLHSCATPNVQWCNCRARLHLCPGGVLRSVSMTCSTTKALPRMLWQRQDSGHSNLAGSVGWPSWLPSCLFYFPQWLEMSSWVQRGSTTTTIKKTLCFCVFLYGQKQSFNQPNQTGNETTLKSYQTDQLQNSCWCWPYSQRRK